MSETAPPYAGITALPAGWERGEAEAAQWRALALALLTTGERNVLRAMLAESQEQGVPQAGQGWPVIRTTRIIVMAGMIGGRSLETLSRAELIEWAIDGYRLTPFGAQVAAALGEG